MTRVYTELAALTDSCEAVDDTLVEGIVVLRDYSFPSNWTPDTGDVLLELPDAYPTVPPRVYLSDEMQYQGEPPPQTLDCGPDGWRRYDVYDPDEWNPARHTLETTIQRIDAMLANEHPETYDA